MSIKSILQTLINTKLASGTDITAAELREVEDALLLNSYGTIINEKQDTVGKVITSPNISPLIKYDINFTKQGRLIFISGFIKNDGNLFENIDFFEIISNEYLPASNPNSIYTSNAVENDIYLSAIDNTLYATVPALTTISFSLIYNSLN